MASYQPQQHYSAARRHNPGRFQFPTIMNKENETTANPLTQTEARGKIGSVEAVTLNFIPQMLTSIAMEQATELADYTRDHRMSEHKALSRLLRECVKEYDHDTRRTYGAAYGAHVAYLARLKETTQILLFQCWCTYTNEASRQHPKYQHKDIPARLAFIRMLLLFVEIFDTKTDRILSEKLGRTIKHHASPWVTELSALCIATAIEYDIALGITPAMKVCIQAVAQNARKMAKSIMADEANVSKR